MMCESRHQEKLIYGSENPRSDVVLEEEIVLNAHHNGVKKIVKDLVRLEKARGACK